MDDEKWLMPCELCDRWVPESELTELTVVSVEPGDGYTVGELVYVCDQCISRFGVQLGAARPEGGPPR